MHNIGANEIQKDRVRTSKQHIIIKLPNQTPEPGEDWSQDAVQGGLGKVWRPLPSKR